MMRTSRDERTEAFEPRNADVGSVDGKTEVCPSTLGRSKVADTLVAVPKRCGPMPSDSQSQHSGSSRGVVSKRSERGTASPASKKDRSPQDSFLALCETFKTLSGAAFIDLKKDMEDNYKEILKEVDAGPSSMLGKLLKATEKLDERTKDHTDLPHTPSKVASDLKLIADALRGLISRIRGITKCAFTDDFEIFKAQLAHIEKVKPVFHDLINAMNKKSSVLGGHSRETYQHNHWCKRRASENLAGGGHSAGFSKLVSPAVDPLRYACKRMQRYALQMSSRKNTL